MKLEIAIDVCRASAHPDGAFRLIIKGVPAEVLIGLAESHVSSVEGRLFFECIVENSRLVGELVERLKASAEIPNSPELTQDELFHILALLDMYWD